MTGLNLHQFKNLVVRPALESLKIGGLAAVNLVTGTALAESGLVYLTQMDDGPALGLFQMESKTHDDIWKNFLPNKLKLKANLQGMVNSLQPDARMMIGHLAYASAMCRIEYMRTSQRLPVADDAIAMAHYHRSHYNISGKADPQKNTPLFRAAINA
ncbi:hypothetical protein FAI40_01565 [Acetobacteraceae bacterium]|nr:hypothetical protein FAI40_01565 [Acetobacteraceae bacterium]